MSDEPGFRRETLSTYEPTPEERIAQLRNRIEELEDALREIVELSDGTRSVGEIALIAHRVARSALAEPTAEDVGKLKIGERSSDLL